MDRNDKILLTALALAVTTIALVAYAPSSLSQNSIGLRLWSLADSTVFIAIVSTFVAAFAGTWGAQRLAERSAAKRAIVEEVHGLNMSLALAFNIVNTYLVVKQQHTQPLCAEYKEDCEARLRHKQRMHSVPLGLQKAFEYSPNFRTFPPPIVPIEELKQLLLNRISLSRAHILVVQLAQTIDGLATLIEARNSWISEFRKTLDQFDNGRSERYFGIESSSGHTDRTYPTIMEGLEKFADDCIGFGLATIEALRSHGLDIERKKPRIDLPSISDPNFEKARDAGLIPEMEVFRTWGQQPKK